MEGIPRSTEVGVAPTSGLAVLAAGFDGNVRITAIEAIPYTVPYKRPAGFASGLIDEANNVLVRVHTDVGVVGHAEAQPRPYTYGETQTSIVSVIEKVLAPQVVGSSPFEIEEIGDRCAAMITNNQVARGAFDLALWDAAGRLLEKSCSQLMGGTRTSVPVAHMLSFGAPEKMAEEALALKASIGIDTFKVKVGRTYELDVASVQAIRDALPDATLYVDANRGWSFADARRIGKVLIELGVEAIEEPIPLSDRTLRRELAELWSVPLVGDESCVSLLHVDREIDDGAVGMVSLKTARTGFTESRRIIELCSSRGVPVVMGSQYEGSLGAFATIAFASANDWTAGRPAEATNFLDLRRDIVVQEPTVRDGEVLVPEAPGLGTEVDEDALAHFREDR